MIRDVHPVGIAVRGRVEAAGGRHRAPLGPPRLAWALPNIPNCMVSPNFVYSICWLCLVIEVGPIACTAETLYNSSGVSLRLLH